MQKLVESNVYIRKVHNLDPLHFNNQLCHVLNRWAMFGFAVGLLTEYATGSDLVDQVKILFSNFGILDLE